MAEKKYYWIKLKKDFIDGDVIDFLMSQKDGANYVVLYEKLCMMCLKTDGRMATQIGEVIIPYDAEKIQRDCKYFSIDTVRTALELFKRLGLIYTDENGILYIAGYDQLVGSESSSTKRVRALRARNKQALESKENVTENVTDGVTNSVTCNAECNTDVTQNVTTEIRDKSLEIREQSLDTRSLEKDTKPDKSSKEKHPTGAKRKHSASATHKVRFPEDEELDEAFNNFAEMRKKIRAPLTDNAEKLIVNKLVKLSNGNREDMIAILNQSTENSWRGVFPLRREEPYKPRAQDNGPEKFNASNFLKQEIARMKNEQVGNG